MCQSPGNASLWWKCLGLVQDNCESCSHPGMEGSHLKKTHNPHPKLYEKACTWSRGGWTGFSHLLTFYLQRFALSPGLACCFSFLSTGSDRQQAARCCQWRARAFQRKCTVTAKLAMRPRHIPPTACQVGWIPTSPSLPRAALPQHKAAVPQRSLRHNSLFPTHSCPIIAISPRDTGRPLSSSP